jgi:hypothetical protein
MANNQRVNKAQADVIKRLSLIRALTLAVNNDPDLSVLDTAEEYFAAMLDILEGKTLKQLDLNLIKKDRVERYLIGD